MKKISLCLLALQVVTGTALAAPVYKVGNTIAIGGEARWDYILTVVM